MSARPNAHFHVQTPRLRFFCRTSGADDGIPLLLLHGSYGTGRWWERFCAALPDEIYAVAPDLRGCGQSDKPDGGYTVEEQTADIAALADALRWQSFHLMAHSSSGAVAMEYALQYGHRLDTLTLVDSVPVEGVFTPLDGYLLLEQMRTDPDLLREALRLLMPALPLDDAHPENVHFFAQLVADAAEMAPAAFTEIARGLAQWNRFGDARQLTLPTLLIWGALDSIVDRAATTRTLIAIPGADNLEVLPNAGHSPMIEVPGTLAARWVDFLVQDHAGYDDVRRSAFDNHP
ncbi:MAG: alpha/beta hydrolase [Caldilineaceae bacterium]|nr:alpha/beta hydrolase [Caldilineaceae bacterium]